MFHIFTKKLFLVDYLENFIDIHNHILPGIDDGAKTVEDSLEIISEFSTFGVNNFICTPHIMHNYYPNTPETIHEALINVKNKLQERGLKNVDIASAAEHMIDDNFENLLKSKQIMPIQKTYLLVEMSYLQPPLNFDTAIIETANHNLYPILAHPERYNFLHHRMQKYGDYKKQGIQFQMNLLSLSDFYGKAVFKTALKLLDEDMIDFVASDAHGLQHLKALKNLTISKKTLQKLLPIINKTIAVFY